MSSTGSVQGAEISRSRRFHCSSLRAGGASAAGAASNSNKGAIKAIRGSFPSLFPAGGLSGV